MRLADIQEGVEYAYRPSHYYDYYVERVRVLEVDVEYVGSKGQTVTGGVKTIRVFSTDRTGETRYVQPGNLIKTWEEADRERREQEAREAAEKEATRAYYAEKRANRAAAEAAKKEEAREVWENMAPRLFPEESLRAQCLTILGSPEWLVGGEDPEGPECRTGKFLQYILEAQEAERHVSVSGCDLPPWPTQGLGAVERGRPTAPNEASLFVSREGAGRTLLTVTDRDDQFSAIVKRGRLWISSDRGHNYDRAAKVLMAAYILHRLGG